MATNYTICVTVSVVAETLTEAMGYTRTALLASKQADIVVIDQDCTLQYCETCGGTGELTMPSGNIRDCDDCKS